MLRPALLALALGVVAQSSGSSWGGACSIRTTRRRIRNDPPPSGWAWPARCGPPGTCRGASPTYGDGRERSALGGPVLDRLVGERQFDLMRGDIGRKNRAPSLRAASSA